MEENINFPKWSPEHPSNQSIAEAVKNGEQYICVESGKTLGAVVLSTDPEGFYEAGEWSRYLREGEYLVIHALAVNPLFERRGVGTFMVKECIELAKRSGFKALRLDVVPENFPAARLYQKMNFAHAGTKDLQRNIAEVPLFDLFELNF